MKLSEFLDEHGFEEIPLVEQKGKKVSNWQDRDTGQIYNTQKAQMIVWERMSPGLRAELVDEMRKYAQRFKGSGKVHGGRQARLDPSR